MYTAPLIAGTNRKAICCVLRTVTAIDHPLLILLRINNWCLYIYILMIYHNDISAEGDLTNEDEKRLVTWLTLIKLNWSNGPFWVFGDKVTVFCDIDFKEVVIWSLIVRSYSCDWRCGRISRWTGFREKRRQSVIEDRSWTLDVFMLKIASRWKSVNQWKSTTTATSSEDSGSTEQIASSWDEHC